MRLEDYLALLYDYPAASDSAVAAPDPPVIETASLPDGEVDSAYSQTLSATGGTEPYTWAVTTGSLPAGLSLNASTGAITGTPSAGGTSTFTVTATDAASQTDTQELTLAIVVIAEFAHSDLCLYSASANELGFAAPVAFDSATSYWLGTHSGVDWLQVDAGPFSAWRATSYSIKVNVIPEPNRAPKDWTLKGSNDGSSWTVIDTRTNQTSWSSGEVRTYTVSGTPAAYRYFRLDITANNGDATYTQVAELSLYGVNSGGAPFSPRTMTDYNAPSPYVATESSYYTGAVAARFWRTMAASANDHNWLGQGGGVDWGQIDLGAASSVCVGYVIRVSSEFTRAPKDWTLKGSNNGSTWTTLDTRTSETGWSTSPRGYTPTVATTAYRYYRLDITANNGDGTYTRVDQFLLYA